MLSKQRKNARYANGHCHGDMLPKINVGVGHSTTEHYNGTSSCNLVHTVECIIFLIYTLILSCMVYFNDTLFRSHQLTTQFLLKRIHYLQPNSQKSATPCNVSRHGVGLQQDGQATYKRLQSQGHATTKKGMACRCSKFNPCCLLSWRNNSTLTV